MIERLEKLVCDQCLAEKVVKHADDGLIIQIGKPGMLSPGDTPLWICPKCVRELPVAGNGLLSAIRTAAKRIASEDGVGYVPSPYIGEIIGRARGSARPNWRKGPLKPVE